MYKPSNKYFSITKTSSHGPILTCSGSTPSIASHRLNIIPLSWPTQQKTRCFHPDRQKIIQDEVDKLLAARFIREVEYLDWLENVVLKKGEKKLVCVDYINLNDVCPKDSFPLPRIDQIMDSTVGHGMLSFLDAFSSTTKFLCTNQMKKKLFSWHHTDCITT